MCVFVVLIIGNCECGEVADGAIDDYWLFNALIRGGSGRWGATERASGFRMMESFSWQS